MSVTIILVDFSLQVGVDSLWPRGEIKLIRQFHSFVWIMNWSSSLKFKIQMYFKTPMSAILYKAFLYSIYCKTQNIWCSLAFRCGFYLKKKKKKKHHPPQKQTHTHTHTHTQKRKMEIDNVCSSWSKTNPYPGYGYSMMDPTMHGCSDTKWAWACLLSLREWRGWSWETVY